MNMFRFEIVILLLFSTNAFSFDWSKCKQSMYGPAQVFALSTSSAQFSTSTGGCAMIGKREHDKKVFIAHNIQHIQAETARGEGEYLFTYIYLSGCPEIALQKLVKLLRSNYTQIYGLNLEFSPEQVNERIEQFIFDDIDLRMSCRLKA